MNVALALLVVGLASCTDAAPPASTCGSQDGGDRCFGADPGYVFSPPLPSGETDGGADGGTDNFFTDEACRAFLDQQAQGLVSLDQTSRAPHVSSPVDGATISGASPPAFTWTKGPGASNGPLHRLLDWLEPSAYAHGSTTGDGYVVLFTQGCNELLRVMLEASSWVPDADSWSRLRAAKGAITLTVVWAKWVQNDVASGLSPAASRPINFTIGP